MNCERASERGVSLGLGRWALPGAWPICASDPPRGAQGGPRRLGSRRRGPWPVRQTGCGGRACAGGDGTDRAPSRVGVTNGEAPGAAGRPGHRSRRAKALAERTGASEVPRGPGWCGEGACPRGPRGGGRVRVPCAPTPPSNVFALSGPSDPRRPRSITGQKPIRKTLRPKSGTS